MTKDEILEYFKYINNAYNECNRYDDLSNMLDELVKDSYDAGYKAGFSKGFSSGQYNPPLRGNY